MLGAEQEANRESAARSRDKRLKLISDLETEVQQLKRQHEAFKVRSSDQIRCSSVPLPTGG